jgi:hypothetical protein
MSKHVIWKSSINCPPITANIEHNEKYKKQREEDFDGSSFPFVKV